MLKNLLGIYLLFITGKLVSQSNELLYEQHSFDFYNSVIVDSFSVKKKINVYPYAFDFHSTTKRFVFPKCIESVDEKQAVQFKELPRSVNNTINFDTKLDFEDLNKKIFRVKKYKRGGYPKLFISKPHFISGKDKSVFVNLYEQHSKRKEIIYHIELDSSGKVLNWCRSEYFEIVIN